MKLLTARKVAWFCIIAGVAWFIYVSPKTPLEFFDAKARDDAAIRELKLAEIKITRTVGTGLSQKWGDLKSCMQRMDRIALLYDITNDPQRVNLYKYSIVEGSYDPDENTKLLLRERDENYRDIQQEFERCREAIKSDNDTPREVGGVRGKSTNEKVFDTAIFRMELETSLLRQFQARLFWRNIR